LSGQRDTTSAYAVSAGNVDLWVIQEMNVTVNAYGENDACCKAMQSKLALRTGSHIVVDDLKAFWKKAYVREAISGKPYRALQKDVMYVFSTFVNCSRWNSVGLA